MSELFDDIQFAMRAEGAGYLAIANYLNGLGVLAPRSGKLRPGKNRPGKWGSNTVYNILRNPVYKGDWTYNREASGGWVKYENPDRRFHPESERVTCEGAHEPIVAPDLYDKAQSVRNHSPRNAGKYRNTKSPYLLSGLIKCLDCGYNFQGHIHKNKFGEWRYYKDGGFYARGKSVCSSFHIPKDSIEGYVVDVIRNRVIGSANMSKVEKLLRLRTSRSFQIEPRSAEIEARLSEIADALENIKDSIEKGLQVDFIRDRIDKLGRERDDLIAERFALADRLNRPDVTREALRRAENFYSEFETRFDTAPLAKKRELLQAFVGKIEVSHDQRTAQCYFNRLPGGVKVYECRRSELDTDFNSELYIVSTLKLRPRRRAVND